MKISITTRNILSLLGILLLSLTLLLELVFQANYKTGFFKVKSLGVGCTYTTYPDLYHLSEKEFIEFCRDSAGFITDQSKKQSESSIYLCGGSVTESYVVPQNQRWPVVLQKNTNMKVVNDGLSGRTFSDCRKRLINYLDHFQTPSLIIIATSVNTVGKFAHDNSESPTGLKEQLNFKFAKVIKSIMPGFSTARGLGFFRNLSDKLSFTTHRPKTNNFKMNEKFVVDYSYSDSLNSGCCHFASGLNRNKFDAVFNWELSNNLKKFEIFYEQELNHLQQIIEKFNYPKSKVILIIESNSYGLGSSKYGDPKRVQALFKSSNPGEPYPGIESARIMEKFDLVIRNSLDRKKWGYFDSKSTLSKPEYFYDAVHLTPEGSFKLGTQLSNEILMRYRLDYSR